MIPGIKPCTGPGCKHCESSEPGVESRPVQGCIAGGPSVTKTSTTKAKMVPPTSRASPKSKKSEEANQAAERSAYAGGSNSAGSWHHLGSTPGIIPAKATKVTQGRKKPGASGKYLLNFRSVNANILPTSLEVTRKSQHQLNITKSASFRMATSPGSDR